MSANSSVQTAGPSGIQLMTRNQLYDIMQERKNDDINKKLEYLEQFLLNQQNYIQEERYAFKRKLSYVKTKFKRKWLAACSKEDTFKLNNKK